MRRTSIRMCQTMLMLARHGQTLWNRHLRYQGQTDIPLCEEGRRQAMQLAQGIRRLGWIPDAIYSSDLLRSLETARIVASILGSKIILDPRLRERRLGPVEGLTKEQIRVQFGVEPGSPGALDKIPNVEPASTLIERMDEALGTIVRRHFGSPVLVISHGSAISHWLRATVKAFPPRKIENGEVFALTVKPWRGTLRWMRHELPDQFLEEGVDYHA